MISSVVPYIDTVLGLSLVAVAAAIHFRPRRHGRQGLRRVRVRVHRRPHRLRIHLHTLPAPLATAGVALIVLGWLWPGDQSPHPGAAPALLPEAAPTGDVTPTAHGVVLVRGTPTDDDTANDDDIRNYSQRLGTLVAQSLARPPLALHLEPRAVDAEQWKAIRDDPTQARGWCEQTDDASFVAVVGLAALRLEDGAGYAPWREPEYVIVSCTSSRHATVRGRVDERLGDRVPYEQAIVDDLKSALGKLVARSD
jgi:hypothetical protein